MTVADQVTVARSSAHAIAITDVQTRNAILSAMADLLVREQASILSANEIDTTEAKRLAVAEPLYRRLILNDKKIGAMADSLRSVVELADPIGTVELVRELDAGLVLSRVRVPIGVIGVIFESRPDALVQIASLAIKSGNAVILKGGSEALNTNRALHTLFVRAIESVDSKLSGALQLVETREDIKRMLELHTQIDLVIPRGSNELVRYIQANTKIPVLGHADGICHLYIHADADRAMAVALSRDAKTQYPAVCNAIETLLVHADATDALPAIVASMPEVEMRGCERTRAVVSVAAASEADWRTEYNDNILSIRIVDSLDEAIEHINAYGSHHTDAIVTRSGDVAASFMNEVDSSSVLWNASTRFADGFRFGLGAEVGISTGKIHARGPVGLEGLTTTQYRVAGSGQIVADYVDGKKSFTHRDIS